jgi:hypothetical protein
MNIKKILEGYKSRDMHVKFPVGKQRKEFPEHSSLSMIPRCGLKEIEFAVIPSKQQDRYDSKKEEEYYEFENPTATHDRELIEETGIISIKKQLISMFPREDRRNPFLQHELYAYLVSEYDDSNFRTIPTAAGEHPPLWVPLTLLFDYMIDSHIKILSFTMEKQRLFFEKMIHCIVDQNQTVLDQSKKMLEVYYPVK